jgi:signal transduction histidine kinase
MLTSVWQPVAARATAKRLRVAMNVPQGVEVNSDPVLLRSILANLVENAVEYTPDNGTIRIDSDDAGSEGLSVRVTNETEHLTADDVPKLFDRFWRRDRARSGTEHSGLGLSLARAFALALGSDLTATLGAGECLTLTLTLFDAGASRRGVEA